MSSKHLFIFHEKHYIRSKKMFSALVLIYFDRYLIGHTIEINCITFQAINSHIRLIFSINGSITASPSHFVYKLSKKIFLMLHSINWENTIAWLPLLLEILGNTCILIIYFPVSKIINLKLIFFKSRFSTWTQGFNLRSFTSRYFRFLYTITQSNQINIYKRKRQKINSTNTAGA